ncbi:MAG: hypothetical protein AVDCRST_MAG60-151 [uncultured Nocardioides sp.]|uniref:Uncharacterized protein n=1 Tax=uncultured Nocardioides sp. TaxID=198441 RepID=A0A6J4MXS2_9ACTN|nr:MAG: hypothetical protein AVDCRST_MAG60-151 [uncultured Nocardioides sp.]
MRTPTKQALLTASLILVGASAVGCGGGGAPTDASEKEFCDGLTSLFTDMSSAGDSEKEAVAAVKKWGGTMEEVGTPESISEEGRKGFELMMEQVAELDEGDTAKDLERMDEDLSDSDNKAIDAFDAYTTDTCPSMAPEGQ